MTFHFSAAENLFRTHHNPVATVLTVISQWPTYQYGGFLYLHVQEDVCRVIKMLSLQLKAALSAVTAFISIDKLVPVVRMLHL